MDATVVVLLLVPLAATLIVIGTSSGGIPPKQVRELQRRQAEIDAKLDAVLGHLGIALPAPEHPEVERLLAEGRHIKAVKAYRDGTGAELKEAVDAVDEIARRRGLPVR